MLPKPSGQNMESGSKRRESYLKRERHHKRWETSSTVSKNRTNYLKNKINQNKLIRLLLLYKNSNKKMGASKEKSFSTQCKHGCGHNRTGQMH